jgi:pyridoxine kinase
MIHDVVQGIAERGVLGECDGVLSGYMGSAEIGEAVLDAVSRVKAANLVARYCCDPVIGDVGRGVFVRPGIPEFIKEHAVPAADIVTPNHFELDYLADRTTETLAQVCGAVDRVHALGPQVVVVTSLRTRETPADCLDLLVSEKGARCRVRTPYLPLVLNGAGDVIAALFFAHYLDSGSAGQALSLAASSLFGILNHTAEEGSAEMLLVAAQNELVAPSQIFEPEQVSG